MKELESMSHQRINLRLRKPSLDSKCLVALISFFATAFLMLVLFFFHGIDPFGNTLVLMSDLKAQYAPNLFFLKNHLSDINWDNFLSSFSYSSALSLGKNVMATMGYYTMSPFNLLVFFFNSAFANQLVILLMVLKLSFAAAFMSVLICERNPGKNGIWPVVFSVCYSFSSFAITFLFNIIWLDGYLLLPLLLFLIERFIVNKKTLGIWITLVVLFVSNYYIAYMVGIFSFFYLVVRLIENDAFKEAKQAMKQLGKFILVAVLSALSVSALLLPVGIDTIKNADVTSQAGGVNLVSFSLIDIVDQLFCGSTMDFSDLANNLPIVFCGIIVTLFIVMYFVSSEFKGRIRKIRAICMIAIYFIFAIFYLDITMQAFDMPNWFNHRYSFVFVPFFILIAYEVFKKIKTISRQDIYKSFGIVLVLLFVAQSFGEMKDDDAVFITNFLVLVAYFLLILGLQKQKWPNQLRNMPKIVPFIMILIILFEIVGMNTKLSSQFSTYYGGCEADAYSESVLAIDEFTESVDNTDYGHRFEVEASTIWDDNYYAEDGYSQYCDFNGITTFDSSSNKAMVRFLKQLGYMVNYNYFACDYSLVMPTTDAFFSVGLLSSYQDYSLARHIIDDSYTGDFALYMNYNILPLGFAVDNGASDFNFYQLETSVNDKNYFAFQEAWYASMFPEGFDDGFFNYYSEEDTGEPVLTNAFVSDSNLMDNDVFEDSLGLEDMSEYDEVCQTLYRQTDSCPIMIEYEFDAIDNSELYMNVSLPSRSPNCQIYVNDELMYDIAGHSFYSQIFRLGQFEEGETVNVRIEFDSKSATVVSVNFASFDIERFNTSFESINQSEVVLLEDNGGNYVFETNLAEGHEMITTIPYENGWTMYVDGKETEIKVYQNAFIGADVGEGTHTVELVFVAPGLKVGIACSACGVVASIAFFVVEQVRKRKQNKT